MSAPQPPDRDDSGAEPRSIDLREYWLIVRRRWALILVVTILGALAGLGYAKSTGKSYSATAQVVVAGLTQGPVNSSTQANSQVNMSTEQAVAQSPAVIDQAAKTLGVQPSKLQAAASDRLTVTVPGTSLTTSTVLQIVWKSDSARDAQAGANAFANAYLAYRHRELANQIASLQSVLQGQVTSLEKQISHVTSELGSSSTDTPAYQNLSIKLNELTGQASTAGNQLASLPTYNVSGGSVISAALPAAPSGVANKVILAIGALLGLLLGLVVAFIRDLFDDRLRNRGQLEGELGVRTLAVLPPVPGTLGNRWDRAWSAKTELATAARPESRSAEAVRSLRVTLAAVAERAQVRTILVVGADASVSPGCLLAELGVAFAQSGRRVLLVAADMRASPLAQIFGVSDDSGLSELLTGSGNLATFCRRPEQAGATSLPDAVGKRLAVLSAGSQKAQALSLLDSGAMIDLLQRQRDAYDLVLLDSPPATVAADVFALASHVDGVIVITREGSTSERGLEELRRRLDQVGTLLIGGVFIGKSRIGRNRRQRADARSASSPRISSAEDATSEQADDDVLRSGQPEEDTVLRSGQPEEDTVLRSGQPEEDTVLRSGQPEEDTVLRSGQPEEDTVLRSGQPEEDTVLRSGQPEEDTVLLPGQPEEDADSFPEATMPLPLLRARKAVTASERRTNPS